MNQWYNDGIKQDALVFVWTITIFELSFGTAHWIFAMKYWSLSLRIQQTIKQ